MKIHSEKKIRMTAWMKAAAAFCSLIMIAVLFFPIWRIELTAPQYPEGLVLEIWANGLGGNVNVINGLNHYIGMRILDENDFIEFKILPYIITGYAALGILVLILNRRKLFNAWVILFFCIAVISMTDFYKWEYEYGHELNPEAPIKVPGMSYQPPLIGYKKLLNFSAYSIPDIGGWLFAGTGMLLAATWFLNWRKERKQKAEIHKPLIRSLAAMFLLLIVSCSSGPQPVEIGSSGCAFCKMTIMDAKFASQCTSTKGKIFMFDDTHCLVAFLKHGGIWKSELKKIYFSDFNNPENWIEAEKVFLLRSDKIHSPMGGNMAAFSSEENRTQAAVEYLGEKLSWSDINPLK